MTGHKVILRLIVAGTLLSFAAGCMARQKVWHANVRQSPEGDVCFSIEDEPWFESGAVRVAAIIVSQIDERERVIETSWTADFTRSEPPTVLSADTCIQYGIDDASNRAVGPVVPIKPNRRYTVFINSDIKDGDDWENRGYRAYFCVTGGVMQRRVVHEVRWDETIDQRRWGMCRGSNGG